MQNEKGGSEDNPEIRARSPLVQRLEKACDGVGVGDGRLEKEGKGGDWQ